MGRSNELSTREVPLSAQRAGLASRPPVDPAGGEAVEAPHTARPRVGTHAGARPEKALIPAELAGNGVSVEWSQRGMEIVGLWGWRL